MESIGLYGIPGGTGKLIAASLYTQHKLAELLLASSTLDLYRIENLRLTIRPTPLWECRIRTYKHATLCLLSYFIIMKGGIEPPAFATNRPL